MRWPKGPPHLALNPPYLYFCFSFFSSLPSLDLFLIGKPCFSPEKGNYCFFICISLCFSLALFGPPPFFPFSFFVSLSLSLVLFSCFLPVFHFCFWFLLYLSVLFFVSRCYFVFVFLLVVLLCFESSCLISCCFASCFLLLVVLGFCCFHILLFSDFNYQSKIISEKMEIAKNPKMKNAQKRTF